MSGTRAWLLTRDADGIAWLVFDRPGSSANTFDRATLLELGERIAELERSPPRGLVIRSGKTAGFAAGADVREFAALASLEEALAHIRLGQDTFARIEALPCPSVAALQGYALGGGLELALVCRYRVGVDDGTLALGLPEVQLGIQPGFGGSVRAVRLLGVRAAMAIMLPGRSIRAARALEIGLVDRLVPADGLAAAAVELLRNRPAPRRAGALDRLLGLRPLRPLVARALRRQLAGRVRREHYPAPWAIVDQWEQTGVAGGEAFAAEARSVVALSQTESARGLVRVFLLRERLKVLGGRAPGSISRVHVIGAGVMGGDIAAWCALRGLEVTLQDREARIIEPALARAQELFDRRLEDRTARIEAARRLSADAAGNGLESADIVIEAIFEDLAAKQSLFRTAEPRVPSAALLATNTSSITLESIAASLTDPTRLVGLHFFNPVAQMPLIEVIRSAGTAEGAVTAALAFARRIDKLPLPCHSGPGFLVNRVLFPYLYEALHVAGEGVALPLIDRAAVEFGMPMGPIELADVVGLDVLLHVGEIITRALGRVEPPYLATVRNLIAQGRIGRKSGAGFYSWPAGRVHKPRAAGTPPIDLAERLLLPLVNECVACLREGIVADADLVDAGVVFGTGFAPFRGGPLHWARRRGTSVIVARLEELAARHGARFRPDSGWNALV